MSSAIGGSTGGHSPVGDQIQVRFNHPGDGLSRTIEAAPGANIESVKYLYARAIGTNPMGLHLFHAATGENELANDRTIETLDPLDPQTTQTSTKKVDLFVLQDPPKTNKEVLLDLVTPPNGPWAQAGLNWRVDLPLEDWEVVTWDDDQENVTAITIYFKPLGVIPKELGNLCKLERLTLNSCRLTGRIPLKLGDLSNLRKLELSRNRLSGSIPSELGKLSELNELWLNNNQLTGAIPSELGDLQQLDVLYLNVNQLSGFMPLKLYILTVTQLTTKLDPKNKIF